jgi:hypothetical protein
MEEVLKDMGTDQNMVRLYSMEAAARELGGISVWYLRKAITQGLIRPTRLGRRLFLSRDECDRIQREGLPSLKVS